MFSIRYSGDSSRKGRSLIMAMDISGNTSIATQEMATNKTQSGYDVLTKSLEKTEQTRINEQQRLEIAEQTGKGLHLDVKA